MIRFGTRTANDCRAMIVALIADGNPAQFVGSKRLVAVTTADLHTLEQIARQVHVLVMIIQSSETRPQVKVTPITAAIKLGRCYTCDAFRGDPCRTPSNRARMSHKGRT